MDHLTKAREAIFSWLAGAVTLEDSVNEDFTLDHSEIRKALIETERFPKYYAVKENIIINLGFNIAETDLGIERGEHDLVGRYGLFIVRTHSDGRPSFDFELLDDGTSTSEAQDQAVTLVENAKNNVINVRVGIGVAWTFASRPVFKGTIAFFRVARGVEGFTEEKQFDELEKASTVAQSILFPKNKFSVSEAREWLKSHDKTAGKVDSPANFHRFRQFDPSRCESSIKTISFGGSGIKATVCQLKKTQPGAQEVSEPGFVKGKGKKKKKRNTQAVSYKFDVDIHKADIDKGLIYGVVYEPFKKDSHGDHTSPEEIENAAHNFLPRSMMNIDHKNNSPEVEVVESFIAPCNFTYKANGAGGGESMDGERVMKGAWVLVTKVLDDKLLESIRNGERTGYSLEGTAQKV